MKRIFLLASLCMTALSAWAVELKEETAPVERREVALGKLNANQRGCTVTPRNERTVLEELANNDSVDVVQITWARVYKNTVTPMKIVYDKRAFTLEQTFLNTKKSTTYRNVGRAGLCDFFFSGRQSIESDGLEQYCARFSFDWEPTAKPDQDANTGSVAAVCDYVKAKVGTDAKFLDWSAVSPAGRDWYVRAKYTYKAKEGNRTEEVGFFMRDGMVYRTVELSKPSLAK